MGDVEGERGRGGGGEEDSTSVCVLCMTAWNCAAQQKLLSARPWSGRKRSTATDTETKMQHFDVGERHQIKDAPPNTWATCIAAMSSL